MGFRDGGRKTLNQRLTCLAPFRVSPGYEKENFIREKEKENKKIFLIAISRKPGFKTVNFMLGAGGASSPGLAVTLLPPGRRLLPGKPGWPCTTPPSPTFCPRPSTFPRLGQGAGRAGSSRFSASGESESILPRRHGSSGLCKYWTNDWGAATLLTVTRWWHCCLCHHEVRLGGGWPNTLCTQGPASLGGPGVCSANMRGRPTWPSQGGGWGGLAVRSPLPPRAPRGGGC